MSRRFRPRPDVGKWYKFVPCHKKLDTPLLAFGKEYWRIRDACEGVAIFGAPGSGKTSASLAALLRAYLSAGMGGIFCCAKVDAVDDIKRAAEATGRSQNLVFIDATGNSERFNILDYASRNIGGEGFEQNLVGADGPHGRGDPAGGRYRRRRRRREPLFYGRGAQMAVPCLPAAADGLRDVADKRRLPLHRQHPAERGRDSDGGMAH